MTQAQFRHKGDLFSTASPTEASLALLPHLARSGIGVESIQLLDSTVTVYNFEVSDFHTYFVGSQSIWVHNACLPKNFVPKGGVQSLADPHGWSNGDVAKILNWEEISGNDFATAGKLTKEFADLISIEDIITLKTYGFTKEHFAK